MPTTVLGFYAVERVAPAIDEFLAGTASLLWMQLGDSNLTQGGGGYGYTRRILIGNLTGRKQVASHTASAGVFTGNNLSYSSDGNTSDFVPDTLRSIANGGQGDQWQLADYSVSSVPAVLKPFLPTTAEQVLVDTFVPAMPEPGDQLGAVHYRLIHDESDASDYNFEERYKVWVAYPKESTLGTVAWQVRATTGSTNIVNGSLDQSPVGAPTGTAAITVESIATVAAGASWNNGENIQVMPYATLTTPGITTPGSPELGPFTMMLSMFITWPDRPHGYAVMPLNVDGGGSLGQYVDAIGVANNAWTDWKLIAACAAMEGRRTYMVVEVQHALNDDSDEAGFLADLTDAADYILARFDALKTAGSIPSTVLGCVILYSGCIHRIPAATENLAYCYNAARTLADSNSRVAVADFRTLMTEAEFGVIGDGVAHLTSDANYLMHDRRWIARFLTACRLSRLLRSLA